jgi:hypothetical protein
MSASEKQEGFPMNTPSKEHQWLQKLVGEWAYESEAVMGPDKPPETNTGTETVRSLGGLWTLGEGTIKMSDGSQDTTLMTLGYDPEKKRFVGTFIVSMMTHLWIYEGELDQSEKVLTLDTEGPDFSIPGKTAKYKDVIEFKSDDHRVLSSHFQDECGNWHNFMTAHYKRVKQ